MIAAVSWAPASGAGGILWDKAVHFTVYAWFVLLGAPLCKTRAHVAWLTCLAIAYGAAIEWGQQFAPGRDMSLLDFLANSLGALLAAWLIRHPQKLLHYAPFFRNKTRQL